MNKEWKIRATPTKPFKVEHLLEGLRKDHTDKRIEELNTAFNKLENKTSKAHSHVACIRSINESLRRIDRYSGADAARSSSSSSRPPDPVADT